MKHILAHVKLTDIGLGESNKMFRDDDELSDDALKELIDSIRQLGVIQPVLLRPAPSTAGIESPWKYELVAGERRYRASLAAGLTTIPANIQELTDEEAFNVQVTENLQRKDIHPLKEARAYKYLVDKDPVNTPAELAVKFGKTEHYIHTRLKLNDLTPKAADDFRDGHMTLGHALLLARLTSADQDKALERLVTRYNSKKGDKVAYDSINEFQNFVENNIMCKLSSVSFKKDDAELHPKAGPCTTCPKRSGANQLFADIKEGDRCFDPECFMQKRKLFVARQVPSIIEKKPDAVFLVARNYPADPQVMQVLKDHGITPLVEGKDFNDWGWEEDRAISGLWISGDDVGMKKKVYLYGKVASNGKDPDKPVTKKMAIARIDERLQRSEQLDAEKVYARILDALKSHPTQEKPDIGYYNHAEDAFLRFVIWDQLGDDDILEELGFRPDDEGGDGFTDAAVFQIFTGLDTEGLLYILRKVMLYKYGSPNVNPYQSNHHRYFLRKIAEGYKDIPIDQFEAEQSAIAEKRRTNAEKRKEKLESKPKKKAVKKKAKAK